jgi:propanediol dehydratase small subunit
VFEYPLIETAADRLRTRSGRPVSEITVDAVLAGGIGMDDLRVSAEALEAQARFAEQAGRPQLAANLRRAAELVDVPEEQILAIYTALRPGRAGPAELRALAGELESVHGAPRCAALLREAAEAAEARAGRA